MKTFEIILPLYGTTDWTDDKIKKYVLGIFAGTKAAYAVHSLIIKGIKHEQGLISVTKVSVKCVYERVNGHKIDKKSELTNKSGLDVYVRTMVEKDSTSK